MASPQGGSNVMAIEIERKFRVLACDLSRLTGGDLIRQG
jgi:hypothetical protein